MEKIIIIGAIGIILSLLTEAIDPHITKFIVIAVVCCILTATIPVIYKLINDVSDISVSSYDKNTYGILLSGFTVCIAGSVLQKIAIAADRKIIAEVTDIAVNSYLAILAVPLIEKIISVIQVYL